MMNHCDRVWSKRVLLIGLTIIGLAIAGIAFFQQSETHPAEGEAYSYQKASLPAAQLVRQSRLR